MGNLLIQLFYQALLFSLKSLLFSVKCAIHFVQWKTSVFEPWPDVAGTYIQGSGNNRCSSVSYTHLTLPTIYSV